MFNLETGFFTSGSLPGRPHVLTVQVCGADCPFPAKGGPGKAQCKPQPAPHTSGHIAHLCSSVSETKSKIPFLKGTSVPGPGPEAAGLTGRRVPGPGGAPWGVRVQGSEGQKKKGSRWPSCPDPLWLHSRTQVPITQVV